MALSHLFLHQPSTSLVLWQTLWVEDITKFTGLSKFYVIRRKARNKLGNIYLFWNHDFKILVLQPLVKETYWERVRELR